MWYLRIKSGILYKKGLKLNQKRDDIQPKNGWGKTQNKGDIKPKKGVKFKKEVKFNQKRGEIHPQTDVKLNHKRGEIQP